MTYQFKKFEGRNLRLEDRITITKSNSIGFPTKFYTDNKIKGFKYVVLFWDEDSKAIGLHFTNDRDEKETKNRFSILHSDKHGGGIVTRSFFKSNNIDVQKYHGRYEWKNHQLEGVGKLYVIDLNSRKESP